VRTINKNIIFKDFIEDIDYRIICATVALGIGMDIPNVNRVVQFRLPKKLSFTDF
ncbi:hypothetical protein NEUTE1DRAFT_55928, partial [Neurospora tetrasperma FGSC 2508]